MNKSDMNTIDAYSIGMQTLVGSYGEFPRKHGNCFSLHTNNDPSIDYNQGKDGYRIVNFNVENLKHLIQYYELDFPIKILPLSDYIAVIHDWRIPDNYYDDRWCEICCPYSLLPIQQQLQQNLEIGRGNRIEYPAKDSTVPGMVRYVIGDKRYQLKARGSIK